LALIFNCVTKVTEVTKVVDSTRAAGRYSTESAEHAGNTRDGPGMLSTPPRTPIDERE